MRLEVDELTEEQGFNLTPLIDVVFLLLVFFLVATTFAEDDEVEMDLELPESTSGAAPESAAKLLVISIGSAGTLHVDGRPVTLDGLRQRLGAEARRDRDREVLIRGDTRVHFGSVAQALDACQAVKLRRISIAALPAAEAAGTPSRAESR